MSKNNKICVYAICKNEAQFVDRWYESMKEADSIVVLDTGSEDHTVERLRSHGIRVEVEIFNPWRFDVARNKSLELVPDDCNILVCTDLDEVFEPGWADLLRERWDDNIHERAEYVFIWRHNEDGTPEVKYYYNKIHNRNWIWTAPVHEYLTRKDDVDNFEYTEDVTLNLQKEITLHHYPDNNKSRSSYLGLLKLRVEENPKDKISILYLGREYWFYKQYQELIDTMDKVVNDTTDYFTPIQKAFAYMLIGRSYEQLMNNADNDFQKNLYRDHIEVAYNAGINICPSYLENYSFLGNYYFATKQYEKARDIIEEGFKKSKRTYDWVETGYYWYEVPLTVLGLSHYCLKNNMGKALACIVKVYLSDPCEDNLNNLKALAKDISIGSIINS